MKWLILLLNSFFQPTSELETNFALADKKFPEATAYMSSKLSTKKPDKKPPYSPDIDSKTPASFHPFHEMSVSKESKLGNDE